METVMGTYLPFLVFLSSALMLVSVGVAKWNRDPDLEFAQVS